MKRLDDIVMGIYQLRKNLLSPFFIAEFLTYFIIYLQSD